MANVCTKLQNIKLTECTIQIQLPTINANLNIKAT
jgi:hypothetical protein